MNCNHQNKQHCHECEKAKHWDFYFLVVAIALTIFGFWFAGWEIWKYLIWPWVFLVVLWVAKYFIDKEEKKKEKKEADKDQKPNEEKKE